MLYEVITRDMFPEATSKKPMPFEELIQSLTGNTNKQKGKKGGAKNGSENKDVSIDYDLCFGAIQGWMKGRSEVVHPSTIRSASFFDQYVILDEAQDARRITSYNVCYTKLLRIRLCSSSSLIKIKK